jgi:hypothetical protein
MAATVSRSSPNCRRTSPPEIGTPLVTGSSSSTTAPAGSLSVRVDDRVVELDAKFLASRPHAGRPTIEHGYAMTAHSAQGLTCRHALILSRDDSYKEWVYTAMTRATSANRLYVIAERNRGRDEFAPAEPARDGRMLLAAAPMRSREDQLAIQHRIASRQSDRGIER